MDVQLNYQGYQIDVAIPDQNTTCQCLFDFAQNDLQSAVQILYGLPDGSTGEVDPFWPVLLLVQAGAQFQLNEIKIGQPLQTEIQQQNIIQKQNITLIVFVDNEFIMQLQAYEYQTMQDILDLINSNVMIDKIITYELYHKNRNQILSKNTPSDQINTF